MLLLIVSLFWGYICCQDTVVLTFSPGQAPTLYDGQPNPDFIRLDHSFDCSSSLYAYSQPAHDFETDRPLTLRLDNLGEARLVEVSAYYDHFTPLLNASLCTPPSCTFELTHNCPGELNSQNYFDIIELRVASLPTLSYYLDCNSSYNPISFEWGQLLITICATAILIVATLFARLEAFGGSGIEYSLRWIILLATLILGVGLLTLFAPAAARVLLDVVSWILSPVAVGIVVLEVLWAFFKHTCLREQYRVWRVTARVVDVLSLFLGLVLTFAWWFSHKNWIVSDTITICMVVSCIKVFKFTSLKVALASYLIVLSLLAAAAVLPMVLYQQETTSFFIQINSPFQFQVPVLTATYNINCAWISITSIAFPGLLVAYLHRFDRSRATNIYLLTTIFTYFLGSILWNVVSTLSLYPIPFDAVTQPFMILAMSLMALNRKQLRTIWDGTFYDEEFVNKDEIQMLGRSLSVESPHEDILRDSIPNSLFLDMEEHSHELGELKGPLLPQDEL